MADIKLIALDLDGTLLTSDKKISDRNLAALKAAQAKGVKVVLTTGRPLKAMDFFLHELGTDSREDEYTITFNGGLFSATLEKSLIKQSFLMMMWLGFTRRRISSTYRSMLSAKGLSIRFNQIKIRFMLSSILL